METLFFIYQEVDKVSQPPPDHSVAQTGGTKVLVLFDKHITKYGNIIDYSSYIIYHFSLYIKRRTRFPSRPLTTLWSKHGATKSKHSTTTPQFDTTLTNRKQST